MMSDKNDNPQNRTRLIGIIGYLVVDGVDRILKTNARMYLLGGGKYTEFAQAIINAKEGMEKQAAREALRMLLIDTNFVEVENVRL